MASVRRIDAMLRSHPFASLLDGFAASLECSLMAIWGGDLIDTFCKGGIIKLVERVYQAFVETDGHIRLGREVHLEKVLNVLVAAPRIEDRRVGSVSGMHSRGW